MALLGRHAPLPVTYAGGARTLVRGSFQAPWGASCQDGSEDADLALFGAACASPMQSNPKHRWPSSSK